MSTSYHIFIAAPDVTSVSALLEDLRDLRPSEISMDGDDYFPERTGVTVNRLQFDVFNERLSMERAIESGEMGFGFDFDFACWVEFKDDTARMRKRVLQVAEGISALFSVSVLYNTEIEIARTGSGNTLEVIEPDPPYIADVIGKTYERLEEASRLQANE